MIQLDPRTTEHLLEHLTTVGDFLEELSANEKAPSRIREKAKIHLQEICCVAAQISPSLTDLFELIGELDAAMTEIGEVQS